MRHRATGLGSMPGSDFPDSIQTILGEVGDLPHLAELPARGVHAGMIGRTLGLVSALAVDLQPAGWRLTDGPGVDQRRATSLLAQDLDAVEELTGGSADLFKVQVTGPWTLAAVVERPRGDKVLGDYGARRDLAQALAEGVRDHLGDVRRRLGGARLVLQVDEPALPAVLAGAIPTASGFHRHRTVAPPEAAAALDWLLEAAGDSAAETVVHCCQQEVPFDLLAQTSVGAVSFDLSLLTRDQYDPVAAWAESDRRLWPGVVPALTPGDAPKENDLTRRVLQWWSAMGFTDAGSLPDTTVTPACGLAGASVPWAREALGLAARVARNLGAEHD